MEQVEMFPSVNPTDSTVPKAGAAEPASTATAHEEGEAQPPCCRICYGTERDGEDGPLFRPCSCRGTMAWVHMECLDRWRKTSVNPRSFYRCDQCHFQYRLGRVFEAFPSPDRFSVARLLGMRFAVHVISVGALLSLVFFAGFFGEMIIPELTWYASAPTPTHPNLSVHICFHQPARPFARDPPCANQPPHTLALLPSFPRQVGRATLLQSQPHAHWLHNHRRRLADRIPGQLPWLGHAALLHRHRLAGRR